MDQKVIYRGIELSTGYKKTGYFQNFLLNLRNADW